MTQNNLHFPSDMEIDGMQYFVDWSYHALVMAMGVWSL